MSTWKGIIGRKFTASEFDDYVRDLVFTDWKPSFVVVHNTSSPRAAQWHSTPGERRMQNLQDYYRNPDPDSNKKAWSAGPHLFVADDFIWVFTPLNTSGVHSPSWNGISWGVEMVGEFDEEPFTGGVLENTVAALASLHAKLGLDPSTIRFHKEDAATDHKHCPGRNVVKADLIQRVMDRIPAAHDGEHHPGLPILKEIADTLVMDVMFATAKVSAPDQDLNGHSAPEPDPTKDQVEMKPVFGTATVDSPDGTLNIRCAPEADATKIGVLKNGESVGVHATIGPWCRISAVADLWVLRKFLKADPAPDEHVPGVPASPTSDHHVAQVDTLYEVFYSESAGKTLRRDVPVYQLTERPGLFHRGSMQIDVDGSPRAYFPHNANPLRLDDMSSADGQGGSSTYIQGQQYGSITALGPRPGFYVSATSLRISEQRMWDCDNFVDAESVPYFIHPPGRNGMNKGDVGIIVHVPTMMWTAAIFGDSNDHRRVSEASLRVAVNLGRSEIDPATLKVSGLSAGNGDDARNYFYLYFAGQNLAPAPSAPHWPESAVKALAEPLFNAWGGLPMVTECLQHI